MVDDDKEPANNNELSSYATAKCPNCGGTTRIDPESNEQICSICCEPFYNEA